MISKKPVLDKFLNLMIKSPWHFSQSFNCFCNLFIRNSEYALPSFDNSLSKSILVIIHSGNFAFISGSFKRDNKVGDKLIVNLPLSLSFSEDSIT